MSKYKPVETMRRKAAFVFRYFAERSIGHDGRGNYRSLALEATTTFDDGADFCAAFAEAFPGKTPDPNHTRPPGTWRSCMPPCRTQSSSHGTARSLMVVRGRASSTRPSRWFYPCR